MKFYMDEILIQKEYLYRRDIYLEGTNKERIYKEGTYTQKGYRYR